MIETTKDRRKFIAKVQSALTSTIGALEVTKDKAVRQLHAVTEASEMMNRNPDQVPDIEGLRLLEEQTMESMVLTIGLVAGTVADWHEQLQEEFGKPAEREDKGKGQSVDVVPGDQPLSPGVIVTQTAPPLEVSDTKPDVEITMKPRGDA